ncbi:hypothetical protein JTB14_021135 [Gonioctena quinquepunctata]|nr:hypothetical protein JTB14_021135 [Gonioctena quinquepunctata]
MSSTIVCLSGHQTTDLLEDCQKLLERFKYPWEMMPLMYAILKDARADLEEASRRIDEGNYLLRYHDSIEQKSIICNLNRLIVCLLKRRITSDMEQVQIEAIIGKLAITTFSIMMLLFIAPRGFPMEPTSSDM